MARTKQTVRRQRVEINTAVKKPIWTKETNERTDRLYDKIRALVRAECSTIASDKCGMRFDEDIAACGCYVLATNDGAYIRLLCTDRCAPCAHRHLPKSIFD